MELRFQLQGAGWAEATVLHENGYVIMPVSYLTDALGDLARATAQLLEGHEVANFYWIDEPGAHRWSLTRTDGDVRVVIAHVADGMFEGADESDAAVVVDARVTVGQFGRAVLALLDSIAATHEVSEYERLWIEHPYPAAEHRRIAHLVGAAA